jgi:hypothetical protein
MQFNQFKQVFQANFNKLIEGQVQLYVTDVDKHELWDAYLAAFPSEEKQGFNCNCCRQFIKQYGNVVAIKDGAIKSMWDFTVDDVMYSEVIAALNNLVCESNITNVFVTKQSKLGIDRSLDLSNSKYNKEWQHLFAQLSQSFVTSSRDTEDSLMSDKRNRKTTFKRALDELTIDATETVLDLIESNSLYRGETNKLLLTEFLKHQQDYSTTVNKDNYCWTNTYWNTPSLHGIRNTSIGSLLIDLSNGRDLDAAIRFYESKVSGGSYMRTNQVISSKKEVEEANYQVIELGLESALNRRFANESDINVNDALFINRSQNVTANIFDLIKSDIPVNVKSIKCDEVSIDDFIKSILPSATNIELLLESRHSGNLVSLVTAVDSAAPTLFKWDNSFSWVYNGGNADSMRERVKAAGGRVYNVVSRFSIQWNDDGDNSIDFDAHCIEPDGCEIAYHDKHSRTTGGTLDVDITSPGREVAVENIVHVDRRRMLDGNYEYFVRNYSSRTSNGGFTAELEIDGTLFSYVYDKNLRGKERIPVVTVKFNKLTGFTIVKSLDSSVSSKEIWGIKTNLFHKVNLISLSPNHWTTAIGEKHYLFMIEGCINSDNPRSIFNEYLKSELVQHSRKVFDVLGDKLKTPSCTNQLSGVGFNSTLRNDFVVRVNGNRTMRVKV